MKKLPNSLLLGVLFCALVLRADFQASNWKYQRSLPVDAGTPLAVLNVDRSIYVKSRPDLADLRVVRGQDEVPYVLERMFGAHERREVSSSVLNQGVTRSGDLELTLDVGLRQRHDGIRLSTSLTNFRQRVSVSTSDNGRTWAQSRDDGYVFDFSQDERHVSVLEVGYPMSTRRYVRLTIHGWNDPKAVTKCWVTFEENKPTERDAMAVLQAEPQQEVKTRSSLYTWDLGIPGIPHDELSLDVDTQAFQRAAVVESSMDGKDWFTLGQGVLSRFGQEQSLALNFPESHRRYLRLRIYNRDDRPLVVRTATLSVIRTRVKFKPAGGGSVLLYYGNADARAPSYDLRELLMREAPGPESTIHPGPEELNPVYREQPAPVKPWSEQHPEILYITLVLAVIGMGIITIRFLRKVGAENRR